MPITITIKREQAHGVFHSMAEGMWEVARDDNVSPDGDEGDRARAYQALIAATGSRDVTYPVTYTLPAGLLAVARLVLANCKDDNDRYSDAHLTNHLDPDYDPEAAEMFLFEGDVVIAGSARSLASLDCATAIAMLIDAVELTGRHEDEPDLEQALQTAAAILAQRGCEHFGEGDRLTELMDVVIFG